MKKDFIMMISLRPTKYGRNISSEMISQRTCNCDSQCQESMIKVSAKEKADSLP